MLSQCLLNGATCNLLPPTKRYSNVLRRVQMAFRHSRRILFFQEGFCILQKQTGKDPGIEGCVPLDKGLRSVAPSIEAWLWWEFWVLNEWSLYNTCIYNYFKFIYLQIYQNFDVYLHIFKTFNYLETHFPCIFSFHLHVLAHFYRLSWTGDSSSFYLIFQLFAMHQFSPSVLIQCVAILSCEYKYTFLRWFIITYNCVCLFFY